MSLLKKISQTKTVTKPVIYGIAGTTLSDEEKYFFSKNGALGFIIFARNIENKIQLKKLTDSLREIMASLLRQCYKPLRPQTMRGVFNGVVFPEAHKFPIRFKFGR